MKTKRSLELRIPDKKWVIYLKWKILLARKNVVSYYRGPVLTPSSDTAPLRGGICQERFGGLLCKPTGFDSIILMSETKLKIVLFKSIFKI